MTSCYDMPNLDDVINVAITICRKSGGRGGSSKTILQAKTIKRKVSRH